IRTEKDERISCDKGDEITSNLNRTDLARYVQGSLDGISTDCHTADRTSDDSGACCHVFKYIRPDVVADRDFGNAVIKSEVGTHEIVSADESELGVSDHRGILDNTGFRAAGARQSPLCAIAIDEDGQVCQPAIADIFVTGSK